MTTTISNFAELLGLDAAARRDAAATSLAKSGKLLTSNLVPGALKQAAAESLIDASIAVLNSPLADVLGDAWTKAHELHAFTDASKYPAGQVSEYTLHTHDISLKRNPVIELVLDGAPTGLQLEFELKISLVVLSALLRIQDGRVIGARVGDFQGAGSYSCGTAKLIERKTSPFKLPGDLGFAPGVAIP